MNTDAVTATMTRKQVAEALALAPKTLANWHSSGVGPPVVIIAGMVRYEVPAFTAWYNENRKAA